MSVFHLNNNQIGEQLDALPPSHTRNEIMDMIRRLQADMESDDPNSSFTERVHRHADAHKELFFSYPMLYRTVIKGSFRPVVLDILLDAREAMQRGHDKKEVLDGVIKKAVDDVNAYRKSSV